MVCTFERRSWDFMGRSLSGIAEKTFLCRSWNPMFDLYEFKLFSKYFTTSSFHPQIFTFECNAKSFVVFLFFFFLFSLFFLDGLAKDFCFYFIILYAARYDQDRAAFIGHSGKCFRQGCFYCKSSHVVTWPTMSFRENINGGYKQEHLILQPLKTNKSPLPQCFWLPNLVLRDHVTK